MKPELPHSLRTVNVDGVTLHLAHPDEFPIRWVGQDELMRQLLAAWMVVDPRDLPMNPRLLGKPGVGKDHARLCGGAAAGQGSLHSAGDHGHAARGPLVTPVIEGEGQLRYVASPLVTAMIRGGIAILDEGNRMSEKSWASSGPAARQPALCRVDRGGDQDQGASRLSSGGHDERRRFHLRSAGVHPFAAAAADPHRLPGAGRGMPILKENLPFAEEQILDYVTDFLQVAHEADERYTVRDGINLARFAMKLISAGSVSRMRP